MKNIIIYTLIICSTVFASSTQESKTRADKQLELQMAKEKQFAKEQKFHQGADYDLKSQEVNLDSLNSSSLDSNPELNEADDDFDMDDVY